MTDDVLNDVMTVGRVESVSISERHVVSKTVVDVITLRVGHGVVGDCHAGVTVQHLSRVRRDPSQPNLRQVHLIQSELFTDVAPHGFDVRPGDLGENITTSGLDLLTLPTGTKLRLGSNAVIELTGLRNPCHQINGVHDGLLGHVVGREPSGQVIRRAGVMGIIEEGGEVHAGDEISVVLPALPHSPLRPV
jgi:MOSC domain-containing protein YiiM